MVTTLTEYWNDENGITTVEYALLLALVVAVAILAWGSLMSDIAPRTARGAMRRAWDD